MTSARFKLNLLGILCGPSEHGKSTVLRRLVLEHLTSHPRARAFVQDPHGEYSPDITRTYDSADAARRALASAHATTPRGFSVRDAWSSVRDLAMEVGRNAGNTKDDVRVPVLAAADESSLMDSASKTQMSREDMDLCSNRRHYGVGILLNVQAVKNLTEGWYQNATDVWVFAQNNDDDARELERRLGLDKGTIRASKLWRAPKFTYAHWRRGEGLVSK